MNRTLTLCATIGALVLGRVPNAVAVNQPVDPPCVWGPWLIDYPPSLMVYPYSLGKEPMTAGQPASISVSANVLPGLVHRLPISGSCPAVSLNGYQYALWQGHVIDPIHWQASNATPSSGDLYADPASHLYTTNFVPAGSGTITFTAQATTTTAGFPAWSETTNVVVPLIILPPKRLGYWRFNDASWIGEEGQSPSAQLDLENVMDWNYGALKMNPPNPANKPVLKYPAYQADGGPNVTRRTGTVRFWYKPSWSSTSPPTLPVTLFQMQKPSGYPQPIPEWSLDVQSIHSYGNLNVILTTGSQNQVVHFTRQISWTAGQWYQFVVTYSLSAGDVKLYLNGALVTSGSAVTDMTAFSGALSTFTIGNDITGNHPATGIYDELETFNYPLPAEDIAANYGFALNLDSDHDGLSNFAEMVLGTDPYNRDTDGDGVSDGTDFAPLDPNRWDPPNPNDTTAPVIQLLEPITAVPNP